MNQISREQFFAKKMEKILTKVRGMPMSDANEWLNDNYPEYSIKHLNKDNVTQIIDRGTGKVVVSYEGKKNGE